MGGAEIYIRKHFDNRERGAEMFSGKMRETGRALVRVQNAKNVILLCCSNTFPIPHISTAPRVYPPERIDVQIEYVPE